MPAYNRILLSAVLEGTHARDAITLRESWADERVTLRLGARVLEIDREHREVMLVDGERPGHEWLGFDRLVLATGSIPTLPPIRGLVRMDAGCTRRCTRSAASRTATGSTGPSVPDSLDRRRPGCARWWWAAGCSASRWPAR